MPRFTRPKLEELMYQGIRRADFNPKAHLYIQTDKLTCGGSLCLSITELAHACLINYFRPHDDAASVAWFDRNYMKQQMLAVLMETHTGDVSDYITCLLSTQERLDKTDAILFVSRDARVFLRTHNDTFLDTLAVCLQTTRDKIMILDMTYKPASFV